MQYANECLFDGCYPRMYSPRMTIGDRLDKAMKDAKIKSQKALERASGVPQPTISRILKGVGKKGPETETIKGLAKALNVSYVWLITGEEQPWEDEPLAAKNAANDDTTFADEITEIVKTYKNASPFDRNQIMNLIKTVAKRGARKMRAPPQ